MCSRYPVGSCCCVFRAYEVTALPISGDPESGCESELGDVTRTGVAEASGAREGPVHQPFGGQWERMDCLGH